MKDWKTTLIGFLAALWILIEPIISKGDFDLTKDWKSLVTALIVAFFGYFVRDRGSVNI
jgi:hypothetical protein